MRRKLLFCVILYIMSVSLLMIVTLICVFPIIMQIEKLWTSENKLTIYNSKTKESKSYDIISDSEIFIIDDMIMQQPGGDDDYVDCQTECLCLSERRSRITNIVDISIAIIGSVGIVVLIETLCDMMCDDGAKILDMRCDELNVYSCSGICTDGTTSRSIRYTITALNEDLAEKMLHKNLGFQCTHTFKMNANKIKFHDTGCEKIFYK